MITIMILAGTTVSLHNCFFFMMRTIKIYSLSHSEVYKTDLLTISLCLHEIIRTYLSISCKFVPLNNISPIPLSPPSLW